MKRAVVVQCADAECRRTLADALHDELGVEVLAAPPAEGSWLKVQEAEGGMLLISSASSVPERTLSKPFRLRDLVTAVASLDAAEEAATPLSLLPGSVVGLEADARRLIHLETGQTLELTEKESALLAALCASADVPAAEGTLLAEVWGYAPEVDTHTLKTHISRLRAKLHQLSGDVAILLEEGGYRLGLSSDT